MKGEKLRDVIEVEAEPPEWPSYYVLTDAGVYQYTGQFFVKQATAPKGRPVQGLNEGLQKVIREVRGDGESAAILLDSMDVIVFDLEQDPFGSELRSWPVVKFCPAAKAISWKEEYEQMDLLE